jgi:hypothetical protein
VPWLVAAGAAVLLSSCGQGGGRKPVYPVRGRVVAGDKPAVGALVIFHPVGAGDAELVKPVGYVGEDGWFSLTTYEEGDGAPEGEYVATVEWRPRSANPFDANKQGADRLKGRYNDPRTSKLRFKVEKGAENTLPPIEVR